MIREQANIQLLLSLLLNKQGVPSKDETNLFSLFSVNFFLSNQKVHLT